MSSLNIVLDIIVFTVKSVVDIILDEIFNEVIFNENKLLDVSILVLILLQVIKFDDIIF
jgi:hypothetical protein